MLEEIIVRLKTMQKNVEKFKPLIELELKSMNIIEFKQNVCFSKITKERLTKVKEGDFLYECGFPSKKYFCRQNRLKYYEEHLEKEKAEEMKTLLKDSEKPMVFIDIVDYGRLAVDCPYYNEGSCPLQDYVCESWEEVKEKHIELKKEGGDF